LISEVKKKYEKDLLYMAGVLSVGEGKDGVIVVVSNDAINLPSKIEGVKIIKEVSDMPKAH